MSINSLNEFFSREKNSVPITERCNKLSTNIDACKNGREILEILEKTDLEVFNGWQIEENIKTLGLKYDTSIIHKLTVLAELFALNALKAMSSEQSFKIIFSGCGTSGRLAYLCSQTFNSYFRNEFNTDLKISDYIIAGDDYALVNSVESVEDKPRIGIEKLKSVLYSDTRFIFIGITCGLSAPFVAGQLDYCISEELFNSENLIAAGVIGFNTVEMSRNNIPINCNNETFLDLMIKIRNLERQNPKRFFILNPLIGPEPITGSSRMKSGTATKIMLDVILTKSILLIKNTNFNKTESSLIDYYEKVLQNVIYSDENKESLGRIIDLAAHSLKNLKQNGSINYLSDSIRLGFLGCVDASECVPTYGASRNDIKGFIDNVQSNQKKEWHGFLNECKNVDANVIADNLESFSSPNCLFIIINDQNSIIESPIEKLLHNCNPRPQIFHLYLSRNNTIIENHDHSSNKYFLNKLYDILIEANDQVNSYFSMCLQEYALKLCLNAISTGAHVLIGKTYQNIMIDVKVSNIKIYWRAVGIIKKFTNDNLLDDQCESYLLDSIYSGDQYKLNDVINKFSSNKISLLEKHVEFATNKNLIVPKALVMALTGMKYNEASELMDKSNNSVRNCIYSLNK